MELRLQEFFYPNKGDIDDITILIEKLEPYFYTPPINNNIISVVSPPPPPPPIEKNI